jgi:SAM-dependent methyltransferase
MTPYASPIDRAKALYRIPTAPARNRTLEVCCASGPLVLAGPWRGEGHACCTIGATAEGPDVSVAASSLHCADLVDPLPFESQSFDLVVLHRTLDDLAATSPGDTPRGEHFLAQVAGLLAPGGVVAGCLQNRDNLLLIARRAARKLGVAPPALHAAYSVRDLKRMLERAGLVDIRVFSLLPNCESPLRLIDIDPRVSRLMFRHELNAGRGHLVPFIAKRLALELGLYRRLVTRAFFFWAYKRC